MSRTRKPLEQVRFELTQEERAALTGYIMRPPKGVTRIAKLDHLIREITLRVAPFYAEGQGMNASDLALIDRATTVLAEAEDALVQARNQVKRARRNLNYLYTGAGMPE